MLLTNFIVGILPLIYRPALVVESTKVGLLIAAIAIPIFFIAQFSYTVFIYPFYISPLRNLPTPSDNAFFFGQSLKFLKVSWMPNLFLEWSKRWPRTPFIRYLNFANSETLLANNIIAYCEILQTKANLFVKPRFARAFAHEVIGDGLPFVEGVIHKIRRAAVVREFSPIRLRPSLFLIQGKALQLTNILAQQVGVSGGVVDIETQIWKTVLDVICIETFSTDFNHLESDDSPLYSAFSGIMLQSTRGHIVNYINSIIPVRKYLPFSESRNFQSHYEESRSFIRQFVTDRLNDTRMDMAGNHEDALQSLIRHSDPLWNTETIVEFVMNLLILGHDTTACAITWAIFELSVRQDIQQRLRSELRNLGHAGTDFNKAQYLHWFVMEVLRRYCPVPMAPREAVQDTLIAGVYIPKGTGTDAEEFNPDRWGVSGGPAQHNFAFETFHQGPRMCIGKHLTIIEMKEIISQIVSRFQISPVKKGPIEIASPAFTLRPKHKLHVHLGEL